MNKPRNDLLNNGLYIFKNLLDQNSIEKLYKKIIDKENLPEIFQTEEEYKLEVSHQSTTQHQLLIS